MTPQNILVEATTLGIRLYAKEGGALGYDAPKGSLTPELRSALAANREAILALLSSGGGTARWHPRPLPWRSDVGAWPLDLRQAWGDRANALQDRGLLWHEAERVAFIEIRDAQRAGPILARSKSDLLSPVGSLAGRATIEDR